MRVLVLCVVSLPWMVGLAVAHDQSFKEIRAAVKKDVEMRQDYIRQECQKTLCGLQNAAKWPKVEAVRSTYQLTKPQMYAPCSSESGLGITSLRRSVRGSRL